MKLRRMTGKVLNILFANTEQTDQWVQSEQRFNLDTLALWHIFSYLLNIMLLSTYTVSRIDLPSILLADFLQSSFS
jgi:hypothetical protein